MKEHFHFIGVGGIGMSGLARLLLEKGNTVSGSDMASNPLIEQLIQRGATIYRGHAAKNIIPHSTIIYSSDIKKDNPEMEAAIRLGCTVLHRSELLARLSEKHFSLAVTGTHGKTTTSALLAAVLTEGQKDPSYAIGGVISQYKTNAYGGKGEHFVLEADESDKSFLNYFPDGAIITNVDNDHMGTYEGCQKKLKQAFTQFASQVKGSKLFWWGGDPFLCESGLAGESYGFEEHCHWKIFNSRQEGFGQTFDLVADGFSVPSVYIPLAGSHNVLNAAAVFAMAYRLGLAIETIRRGFSLFEGVGRRCENKGEINGVTFIDDYAHHPTEILTTLQGIRKAIGQKKLIAVFQPHRYSRTHDCLGQYGELFQSADQVIVTDIYGGGEDPIPGLSAALVQEEIQACKGNDVTYLPRTALGHYLAQTVQPGNIVVTLGAGDVTKVASETMVLMEHVHA